MQQFANELIVSLFGADPASWPYTQLFYLGVMAAFATVVFFGFIAPFSGICVYVERKIAARMQSRIGPNRAGPHGFFIWIADAVKLILKEDLIPDEADKVLFRMGPYLVLLGLALSFVVLPFGAHLVIADMNVGLFFVAAVASIEVVGVLISGWGSNSKWSLLGGFRSAAQIISYEIPFALAFMVVILSAGTLSAQGVVAAQGGLPHEWFIFRSPMHFAAFFIFAIAALAEGNRTPFDLPEAEQELVSGFNTEYSGLRFAAFFLAEFANVWVMNALGTLLFLGGWQIPGVASGEIAGPVMVLLSVAIFAAKTLTGVLVVLWIRWTLPRVRIDQMMDLCWKYLVPIGMALVLLTAGWELLVAAVPVIQTGTGVLMAIGGFALAGLFLKQSFANIAATGDKISMENW